jgi:hypothetical protein
MFVKNFFIHGCRAASGLRIAVILENGHHSRCYDAYAIHVQRKAASYVTQLALVSDG